MLSSRPPLMRLTGWIGDAVALRTASMGLQEARASGAVAMFGEKYGDVVRVVDVPGISSELCGGTHVDNTSEIGGFKIVAEAGIAAGVRRIEAVAGPGIYDLLAARENIVKALSLSLKVQPEKLEARVASLSDEQRKLAGEVERLKGALAIARCEAAAPAAQRVLSGVSCLVLEVPEVEAAALGLAAQAMQERLGDPCAVILGSIADDKVSLVAAFSPAVVKQGLAAGKFMGPLAKLCGGGGGGKPAFAQAGGRSPEGLSAALALATEELVRTLG